MNSENQYDKLYIYSGWLERKYANRFRVYDMRLVIVHSIH